MNVTELFDLLERFGSATGFLDYLQHGLVFPYQQPMFFDDLVSPLDLGLGLVQLFHHLCQAVAVKSLVPLTTDTNASSTRKKEKNMCSWLPGEADH